MNANAIVNKLLESVDPALAAAMQKASADIFADERTQMYGGGRPDKRRAADGYDINCGLCEEWAEEVRQLYVQATGRDEVEVLDPTQLGIDDWTHVFIKLGDRYYDAECPEGVADWRQLPLFVKNGVDAPVEPEVTDAEADSPVVNFDRFAKAIGAEAGATEKKVLARFKSGVRGYIKWVHTDDEQGRLYDEEDLVALRKAKTFAEAEAILRQYESEPSFLYMIRSGYFV